MKKNILSILALSALCITNLYSQNLIWADRIGGPDYTSGNQYDSGNSMVNDAAGNIYTTGFFTGTADFDPGTGVSNLTSAGNDDIFVSKFDNSGNLIWAKQLGGTAIDHGYGIAVDASGNVYTVGEFQGTVDFDPGASVSNLTSLGGFDIFISKLDASGDFVWVKQLGAANIDGGYDIAVDASGNVFTTGFFRWAPDFDPGVGIFTMTTLGLEDAFISKLDTDGNFLWAKQIGGTGSEFGYGITTDAAGNVYTTGTFGATVDFDPGTATFNLTAVGGSDIFISKLDPAGNFVWAKSMGGSNIDAGNDITVDAGGNVYTTGFFWGAGDFDPGAGTFNLTPIGDKDIFVSKLDASGDFVWAKAMGGTHIDAASSIAVDAAGNVYTTGGFAETADFDPAAADFNFTSVWGADVFISKLDANGNFIWAQSIGGAVDDGATAIAIDASQNVYIAGSFGGVVDFDFGTGTLNLSSVGPTDAFIAKVGQAGVGISENGLSNTTKLFPNPTTGYAKILLNEDQHIAAIKLINITGETILEKTNLTGNKFNFDISEQVNGIYFLEIKHDGTISRSKLIKN